MIVVYGEVPELFHTQNAAIQEFSLAKPDNKFTTPLVILGSSIIIGISAYFVYRYFENRKEHF